MSCNLKPCRMREKIRKRQVGQQTGQARRKFLAWERELGTRERKCRTKEGVQTRERVVLRSVSIG
jgi:hypothetical protein